MALGKLIVLEGTDGAGKSTQLELIKKWLEANDLTYDFLHFPKYGHNEFSEIIAKFLRGEFGNVDEVNPYFVANIYAMDRYMYKPTLLQQLENNDVVLLDRYVFSNLAFQGAKYDDGAKSGAIQNWINDFEFEFLELPYPDLTIFLDVPIDVVRSRLKEREGEDREYLKGEQDIHEADLNFQSKVRDIYLSMEHAKNYHIVKCAHEANGYYVGNGERKGDWFIHTPEELFNIYHGLILQITKPRYNGISEKTSRDKTLS